MDSEGTNPDVPRSPKILDVKCGDWLIRHADLPEYYLMMTEQGATFTELKRETRDYDRFVFNVCNYSSTDGYIVQTISAHGVFLYVAEDRTVQVKKLESSKFDEIKELINREGRRKSWLFHVAKRRHFCFESLKYPKYFLTVKNRAPCFDEDKGDVEFHFINAEETSGKSFVAKISADKTTKTAADVS